MREEAVLFGATRSLVGVITHPTEVPISADLPAIILLNSGLVHHVGLNRLHVNIARNLAAVGLVVLRFDFSGIGDSGIRRDHLPFGKSALIEVQEAMNYLNQTIGSKQFVLMGICSGAAVSYKTAFQDSRVTGTVLINPIGHLHGDNQVGWDSLRDRTLLRHYWRILLRSSFSTKNWRKALTGKIVDYRSILKKMFSFPFKTFSGSRSRGNSVTDKAVTDIQTLLDRGVRLYLIHSEGDEGLDYVYTVLGRTLDSWIQEEKLDFELIEGANHTFTLLWSQEYLINSIRNWIQKFLETR